MSPKILLILITIALNNTSVASESFFPDNQILSSYATLPIQTQTQKLQLAEKIEELYTPVFKSLSKPGLNIEFDWNNSRLNAHATINDHNIPTIKVTGGMAGHEKLTDDGLALILCHEIGHFLGGSPKKPRGRSKLQSWSSAEGQADYYAMAVCLKKVFKEIPDLSKNNEENNELKSVCHDSFCKRLVTAGLNVAKIYAEINFYLEPLSLVKPDGQIAYRTIFEHPNPQCRLDTMIAAIKCNRSEDLAFDPNEPRSNECVEIQYARPHCWYNPSDNYFEE